MIRAWLALARLPAIRSRLVTALGVGSVLGLLSYPLPFAWLGLGGLAILAAARWRTVGRPLPASAYSVPLALYLAGTAIGWYVSLRPEVATIRLFGVLAALGALFLILGRTTSATAARRLIGWTLLALGILTPLVFMLIIPEHPGRLPGPLLDLLVPVNEPLRDLRESLLALDEGRTAQRFRLHPSGSSLLAVLGVSLALGPLLAGPSGRTRLKAALAIAYFGLFLAFTGSRAASLSAALIVLLLLAIQLRRLAPLALVLGCGAIALLVAALPSSGPLDLPGQPSSFLARWTANLDTGSSRLELWRNLLYLLGDFSFSGVGLGIASVESLYNRYFASQGFSHAHNIFLQTYLEQGPLGLAGLVGLVGAAFVLAWQALARLREPAARSVALSAAGGVLALVSTGLLEVGAVTTVGLVLLFGCLALVVRSHRLEPVAPNDRPIRASAAQSDPDPAAQAATAVVGKRRGSARLVRGSSAARSLAPGVLACIAAWVLLLALGASPSRPLLARLAEPISSQHAALSLNVAALEIAWATQGEGETRERRRARLEIADGFLRQAAELEPGQARIGMRHAARALATDDRPAARQVLLDVEAQVVPGDDRTWFQVGRLYQQAGDVDRAVAAWSRIETRIGAWNGTGPDVQLILWGRQLSRLGLWRDAEIVYRAAVRLAPIHPEPYRGLALAIAMRCGDRAALAALLELVRTHPDVPWPYAEAAILALQLQDQEQALVLSSLSLRVERSDGWAALQRVDERVGFYPRSLPSRPFSPQRAADGTLTSPERPTPAASCLAGG